MPEKTQDVQAVEAMHQVQSGMARLKYLARQADDQTKGIVSTGYKVVVNELQELGNAIERDQTRGQ